MRRKSLMVASLAFAATLLGQNITASAAEKFALAGGQAKLGVQQVEVDVEVGGDLKMATDAKVKPTKMSVVAALKYQERVLAGKAPQVKGLRSIRYYDQAQATIKFERGGATPKLAPERKLVVVDCASNAAPATLFSPSGPLTRDELDLIDVAGNSLLLYSLLPEGQVALGESWKLSADVLAGVLGLDSVGHSDVESVLTSVEGGVATIEAHGHVDGAIGGVATEIEVKTKALLDLKTRHFTRFGLAVKEKRAIGMVTPGLDVVARIRLKFTPVESSAQLAEKALKDVPLDPHPAVTQLAFPDADGSFRFCYDRRWFIYQDDPTVTLLRMVDRGELIAQCNISRLSKAEPGKKITAENFREGIKEALGDRFKEFVSSEELPADGGPAIYQVIAAGEASELPIQWHYYLITDKQGRHVAFTFTLESERAERFGQTGHDIVRTLEFLKQDEPEIAEEKPAAKTEGSKTEASKDDKAKSAKTPVADKSAGKTPRK